MAHKSTRRSRASSLPSNVLTKDNNKSWTEQDFNQYEQELKDQLTILKSMNSSRLVCVNFFIVTNLNTHQ